MNKKGRDEHEEKCKDVTCRVCMASFENHASLRHHRVSKSEKDGHPEYFWADTDEELQDSKEEEERRKQLRVEKENKKAREAEAKRRENEKRKRREDVETGRETEDEVDGGYECRWCGENYRGEGAAVEM